MLQFSFKSKTIKKDNILAWVEALRKGEVDDFTSKFLESVSEKSTNLFNLDEELP
jgi:hypothetical protein